MFSTKKLIWIITLFIFIPLVTATSYTFEKDSSVNLKTFCVDEVNQPCASDVECNITILYPNNTAMINNEEMTWYPTYYNYILNENETSITGEHTASIFCSTGGQGFSTFTYQITKTGKSLSDSPSVVAMIIAMIGTSFIVIKIAEHFKGEDQRWYGMLFRTVLYVFAIGFCMLAIGILNESNVIIENISGITSSVNLISKLMFFIIIAVGIFAIVYLIERFLLRIKMNKDKEEEEWDK